MVPLQNSAVFWKKDLTLEITGGDNERSDESESGDSGGSNDEFDRNNEGTALNSDGVSFAYNKREMYFSNIGDDCKANGQVIATRCLQS